MRRDDPTAVPLPAAAELPLPPERVVALLAPLLSDERRARIDAVLDARIGTVVPVLEELADPHNGAAVLRTADALGVNEVHVVCARHSFLASSGVSKGAAQWLDLRVYRDPRACVEELHRRGFEVLVAAMDGTVTPDALARRPRVAVVFGNEHGGVSGPLRALADGSYRVPMVGMVESLNVSVAAAVTLWAATRGRPGDLPPEVRARLRARFYMASIRDADAVVRELARRAAGT